MPSSLRAAPPSVDRYGPTRVQWLVKTRFPVGKAVILALSTVSLLACGSGLPRGRQQVSTQALQTSVTDAQARSFYEAREWQGAWDAKS